tara:strand:+ start:342 stop:566 length:225 start_codon:yes stop_codon:yes gene_type:complete
MNTYHITCREFVYFVKEVKADSEDEAREKLNDDVNKFKDVKEWIEEWEIAETELKEVHQKYWVDLPPRHNTRQK